MFNDTSEVNNNRKTWPYKMIALSLSLTLFSGSIIPVFFSIPVFADTAPVTSANPAVFSQGNLLMGHLDKALQACDAIAFEKAKKNLEVFLNARRRDLNPLKQDFLDAKRSYGNLVNEIIAKIYPSNRALGEQLYLSHFIDALEANPTSAMVELQKMVNDPLALNPKAGNEDTAKLKAANEKLQAAAKVYAQIKPTEAFLNDLENQMRLKSMMLELCIKPTPSTKKPSSEKTTGTPLTEAEITTGDVQRAKVGLEYYLDALKQTQRDCDRKKYDAKLTEIKTQIRAFRGLIIKAEENYQQALKEFEQAANNAYPPLTEETAPGKSPTFFWPTDIDAMRKNAADVDETIRKIFENTLDKAKGVSPERRKAFDEAARALREAARELNEKRPLKEYLDRFENDLLRYPYLGKDCTPPKETTGKDNSFLPDTEQERNGKSITAANLVSQAEFVDEDTQTQLNDVSVTYMPKATLESVAVFHDEDSNVFPRQIFSAGENSPHPRKDPQDSPTPAEEGAFDQLLNVISPAQTTVRPGDQFIVHSPNHQARTYVVPKEGVTDGFIQAMANGMLPAKPLNFVTASCADQQAIANISRDLNTQGSSFKPEQITLTPIPMGFCQVSIAHFSHPKDQWPDFSNFPHNRKQVPQLQGNSAKVTQNPEVNSPTANESGPAAPPKSLAQGKKVSQSSKSGKQQTDSVKNTSKQTMNTLFGDIPLPGTPGWYEPEQSREGLQSAKEGPKPLASFYDTKGTWAQNYDDMWALKHVGMSVEQMGSLPSQHVTVAVIDSGIDLSHPELNGQIWTNPNEIPGNGLDDDRNGYVDDVNGWNFTNNTPDVQDNNGHGTMVSGIIAARQDDHTGINGLFPAARIMPLKVTRFNNEGSSIDLARAITYAADNGAKVINLSVGGANPTWIEQRAVDYANSRGILVVAASGNTSKAVEHFSPGGLIGVLTVGSTDLKDRRAIFSNWGANIDLAAPGVEVLSLRARQTDFLQHLKPDYIPGSAFVGRNAGYYRASGSSFSAPFVSAAAALLQSQANGNLNRDQLIRKLTMGAIDIGWPGRDHETGYGLLNVPGAIAASANEDLNILLRSARTVKTPKGVYLELFGTFKGQGIQAGWLELTPNWVLNEKTIWQRILGNISYTVDNGLLLSLPVERLKDGTKWTLRLKGSLANGQQRFSDYQLELK